MKIEPDDPRLTAFAIGELEPGEAAEVEKALADSPDAKAEVDAIRETAALLEEEFGAAPSLELSDQQRSHVIAGGEDATDAEVNVVRPEAGSFSKASRWLGISAAAACVVAVGSVGLKEVLQDHKDSVPEFSLPGGAGASAEAPDVSDASAPEESLAPKPAEGRSVGGEKKSFRRESVLADGAAAQIAAGNSLAKSEGDAGALPPGARGFVADGEAAPMPGASSKGAEFEATADSRIAYASESKEKSLVPSAEPRVAVPGAPVPAAPALAATVPARVGKVMQEAGNAIAAPSATVAPQALSLDSEVREERVLEKRAFQSARSRAMPADATKSDFARTKLSKPSAGNPSYFGAVRRDALTVEDDAFERDDVEEEADELVAATAGRKAQAGKDGESYGRLYDTPFFKAFDRPLSTFSIDVDTASYSNMRRFIGRNGVLPPKDSVRVEEMINYFDYDYPQPDAEHPVGINFEVAACPWQKGHRLVKVGLQGVRAHEGQLPPSNLVFLIDSSGSMRDASKLPLLKSSLAALTRHLTEDDRIGIVTYSGGAGVALKPVHGDQKEKIIDVIDSLKAGGSTNGAGGIELAYKLAAENYVEGGTNRVILATDGDFNVGVTNNQQLIEMVKARSDKDKVFLTVLGFGEGNLKEQRMEQIANKGNGNYFYIDGEKEGRRVLVDKLSSTLVTIAKDVKLQVDFNPAKVDSYRLIGYANRRMAAKDFRDDTKDAGEIGPGHSVTALYQIVPAGAPVDDEVELAAAKSKYRKEVDTETKKATLVDSDELLSVSVRYKAPEGEVATEFAQALNDPGKGWEDASDDFRFSSAVAGFGMLLRESEFAGMLNYELVLELAGEGKGSDANGLRGEFIELVDKAKKIGR